VTLLSVGVKQIPQSAHSFVILALKGALTSAIRPVAPLNLYHLPPTSGREKRIFCGSSFRLSGVTPVSFIVRSHAPVRMTCDLCT